MRKTMSIIGSILAVAIIVYSFFAMGDTGRLFGVDMNIWIYRLIWLAILGINLNGYLKERNNT